MLNILTGPPFSTTTQNDYRYLNSFFQLAQHYYSPQLSKKAKVWKELFNSVEAQDDLGYWKIFQLFKKIQIIFMAIREWTDNISYYGNRLLPENGQAHDMFFTNFLNTNLRFLSTKYYVIKQKCLFWTIRNLFSFSTMYVSICI